MRQRRFRAILLAAFVVVPLALARPATIRADDPTPIVAEASPAPTEVIVSPEAPPSPLPPRPESSPIAISTVALPTASPFTLPTRELIPTVAPDPVVIPTSVPSVSYQPSVADLEANARLRWGKRIPAEVRRWAFLIVPAAHRYGVDPNLVAAVMTLESGGDPLAWNASSDARGLMQVLHGPWDPAQNIDIGTSMLAGFLAQFHDLSLALAAYNAGPNAVVANGGIPPFQETQDYVVVVRYLYDLYGHRKLSVKRRRQYRVTLRDLQQYQHSKKQRQKLAILSRLANVPADPGISTGSPANDLFPGMDPFWPLPGGPDPLQHVGPDVTQP